MNTVVARRLASGDRVVWIGNDGYQPAGPGTIARVTAHAVEVRWDGGREMRYRRAHLHNLRHVKLICEAAERDRAPREIFGFPHPASNPPAHRDAWP